MPQEHRAGTVVTAISLQEARRGQAGTKDRGSRTRLSPRFTRSVRCLFCRSGRRSTFCRRSCRSTFCGGGRWRCGVCSRCRTDRGRTNRGCTDRGRRIRGVGHFSRTRRVLEGPHTAPHLTAAQPDTHDHHCTDQKPSTDRCPLHTPSFLHAAKHRVWSATISRYASITRQCNTPA